MHFHIVKMYKDKEVNKNVKHIYLSIILDLQNFFYLIYPPELEVRETTDTASSASFLDLYLEFDGSGQLSTKIYDKPQF